LRTLPGKEQRDFFHSIFIFVAQFARFKRETVGTDR